MNFKLIDKLWERTTVDEKCWLYQGYQNKHGYCRVWYNQSFWMVHRLSLCIYLGLSYKGEWESCHLCKNKHCWNPLHLYQGNRLTNVEDSISSKTHVSLYRERKTHCINGHEFTLNNIYITPNRKRACRTCRYHATMRHEKIRSRKKGS